MARLTNIREIGRYKNTETGREYNIRKGRNQQRGTDVIFYLYRGKRQFISDRAFYDHYKRVTQQ